MDPLCRSKQAPFEYTLSMMNGKWKMKILYELSCDPVLRYGELKKNIQQITHKMLSTQLKELEADNIVVRREYPQIPPKVEYRLSTKGQSLIPLINAMCQWGKANMNPVDTETNHGVSQEKII